MSNHDENHELMHTYNNMGSAHFANGDYDLALEDFESALAAQQNTIKHDIETTETPFIEDDKLKTFSLSFQTGALLEHSSDGKEFKFSLENITKPTLNSNLVPRNVVMPGFSADDFKEILANEQIQEQIKGLDIGFMVHTPEVMKLIHIFA